MAERADRSAARMSFAPCEAPRRGEGASDEHDLEMDSAAVGSGWPANIAATLARSSATLMRELMEDKVFTLCIEWRRSQFHCQCRSC